MASYLGIMRNLLRSPPGMVLIDSRSLSRNECSLSLFHEPFLAILAFWSNWFTSAHSCCQS
jgi:hypothetical protein